LLTLAPVVPVLIINDLAVVEPLAAALVRGGLPLLEITLRTDCALEAIGLMSAVEGAVVGAGTILNGDQIEASVDAGAEFLVSPGSTPRLLDQMEDHSVPLLPGAASATEAMVLQERGYQFLKFFPVEPSGGVDYLKALASPLPDIQFCPTGGISAATAPDYLACSNVICVGGSWVTPNDLVKAGKWDEIADLARHAAGL
jgi:2-dehydro-3-deoxyphosphogluconate aldolase/(4S)-4-hydroxy-2-oxoglutarate aldolase